MEGSLSRLLKTLVKSNVTKSSVGFYITPSNLISYRGLKRTCIINTLQPCFHCYGACQHRLVRVIPKKLVFPLLVQKSDVCCADSDVTQL